MGEKPLGENALEGLEEAAADGSVERLWVVYEQHCEGAIPALFGGVRLGMPYDGPSTPAYSSWIRPTATDPSSAST
jgi:hypothetical protein